MNDIKTAWLFPGQGSQSVGMGRELLASYEPARKVLEMASELARVDLMRIVARGPEALLARTDILQPALTAINLGCCLLLRDAGLPMHATAGHSLGEFSALYAAGVLDAYDTLRLVSERGCLMHEVSCTLDGGMLAVKGLDMAVVEAVVGDLAGAQGVTIANYNTPAQTVISGHRAGLASAARLLTLLGGHTVELNVSGPWHSPLLQPASERFLEVLHEVQFNDAQVPVVLNVTGAAASAASVIRAQVERQLCSPVRWVGVQATLRELGVQRVAEVGAGKVLRGLLRGTPALADCMVVNCDGPKSLRFVVPAEMATA